MEARQPTPPGRRKRVLFVATHPTQYGAPLWRELARSEEVEITVAFMGLEGATLARDEEFGLEFAWDRPLLEGYAWKQLANRSPTGRRRGFFGRFNPEILAEVRRGGYDCVVSYGHSNLTFALAILGTPRSRTALVLSTDAHTLEPKHGKRWKVTAKRALFPALYRRATGVIAPSTATARYLRELGVAEEKIFLVPYAVDNAFFAESAQRADPTKQRASWGIPSDATVLLFVAKLQPWKRPDDALDGFAKAAVDQSHLVFVGDGPLAPRLKARAAELGILDRVHFIGFLNQGELPAAYAAADLLILPSEHEPFGVVVNEAMASGVPVVASDQVGAAGDLVIEGETGYVFPMGDVDALASTLRDALANRARLREMGNAAAKRMDAWSIADSVRGLTRAVQTVCTRVKPR